jgi:hypothetical protein
MKKEENKHHTYVRFFSDRLTQTAALRFQLTGPVWSVTEKTVKFEFQTKRSVQTVRTG